MDREIAKIWYDALRSGKYTQAVGKLRNTTHLGSARHLRAGHCCLGVLSHCIANHQKVRDTGWKYDAGSGLWHHPNEQRSVGGMLPAVVLYAIDMLHCDQEQFVAMNDHEHKTFQQIAAFIKRKYLA